MIKEAIDRIVDISTKNRASVLEKNGRMWFYRDDTKLYSEVELRFVRSHEVSNMESFVTLVKEELNRAGKASGEGATVTLTQIGGQFRLHDTGDGLIQHQYSRTLDPFWTKLAQGAGKFMKHAEFIRFLSGIAPCIASYDDLTRQFRKVSFDERMSVTSQPLLDTDGRGGTSFAVEFMARGGATKTTLPAGFDATVNYARGSAAHYDVHAEIDIQLRKLGEKSELVFGYYCPEIDGIEVLAQAAEEALCREKLADCPQLLIITNF
jgi:hypothetical protein